MSFEKDEPTRERDMTTDVSGGGATFDNPLLRANTSAGSDDTGGGGSRGLSAAEMIARNQSEMTEQQLADLTYAFQAADMNGEGAVSSDEFMLLLKVFGCDLTEAALSDVMAKAKSGFAALLKVADEENIAKCKQIWQQFNSDSSTPMNMADINAVIRKLQEMGSNPEPLTEEDMNTRFATPGEITFDEFSAWFLKQEGLPSDFAKPSGPAGPEKKRNTGPLRYALAPFRLTTQVAAAPLQLLQRSRQLAKRKLKEDDTKDRVRALMADPNQLIFAEFAFMMRAGILASVLGDGRNWQERAEDMIKLREAFDTADVDGDNKLELEELETVVLNINPKAQTTREDIVNVWNVLNPSSKPWIPFSEFVEGMIKVKNDPKLSNVIPMDVPNRFALLSLVVDSPISEDQEKLIFDKMSGLEKFGIGILRKVGSSPMNKQQIKDTVAAGCDGTLHYLSDEQRKKVFSLHWSCVFQAAMIGLVCTAVPSLLESFLGLTFDTDGAVDAYWTCPGTDHDPWGEPGAFVAPYHNLSLPKCPWGTCTSLPANVTDFARLGGHVAQGGNWSNCCQPLVTECGLTDPDDCIMADWSPQESCMESDWMLCEELREGGKNQDSACSPLPMTSWEAEDQRLLYFHSLNTIGIVIGIVVEIFFLMSTAVRSAIMVSKAIDLRLVPLNAERAFVAKMLVRAALEIGEDEGEIMGVNTEKDDAKNENNIVQNILALAWYKGKAIITGVILKMLVVKFASYNDAMFLKPLIGGAVTAGLWDSMTCHGIMRSAERRAIGVITGPEVFNEIMDTFCPQYESDPTSLSELARVQILRGIGVAIVKHGSMFPTKQILLRHAVKYLNMGKSAAVASSGVIDDEEALIKDMEDIKLNEARAVLCCIMLCFMLDGSVRWAELKLWHTLLERVEALFQQGNFALGKSSVDGQSFEEKFNSLTPEQLRAYIIRNEPDLTKAVQRVPVDDGSALPPGQRDTNEMMELRTLATYVPRPTTVTFKAMLMPDVVCQRFRYNHPITTKSLMACYDPYENMVARATTLSPALIMQHLWREFTFKVLIVLTAPDPFVACREE